MRESIYLIGALRGTYIREFAEELRAEGFDVFDDWHSAGEKADEIWQEYEQFRGHDYLTAIQGYRARNVFRFDEQHILRCRVGVLVLPAGKSAHLELGYMLGQGKRGYILFDEEPKRWDVMYQFATALFIDKRKLIDELKRPGIRLEVQETNP
jgi:hypothetical protein